MRKKSPSEAIEGLVKAQLKIDQVMKKIEAEREIFDQFFLERKIKRELKKREEGKNDSSSKR